MTRLRFHGHAQNKIFVNYGVGSEIVTSDALIDEQYPNGVYSVLSVRRRCSAAQSWCCEVRNWERFRRLQSEKERSALQRHRREPSLRHDSDPHRSARSAAGERIADLFQGRVGGHPLFKFGGEFQHEQQSRDTTSSCNNLILYLNNSAPTFGAALRCRRQLHADRRPRHGRLRQRLLAVNKRLTFNLGLRFDRIAITCPEQLGPQGTSSALIDGARCGTTGRRASASSTR